MKIQIESAQYPLATFTLNAGETLRIEPGSMVCHTNGIRLSAKVNSARGLMGAIGRAMVSGESVFVVEVESGADGEQLTIAPEIPGSIQTLDVGMKSYYLNDGAFLAMDTSVNYTLERQSLGKAVFGRTGGLYVMKTEGQGKLLVNAYGSIKPMELHGADGFTVDNAHVVAWESTLRYELGLEGGGLFQSIGTGEGVVNRFYGTGTVLLQTLNLESLAKALMRYIPQGNGRG